MSDTAQIILTIALIGFVLDGLFWARKQNVSATIFVMGVALILGVILF